VDLLEILMVLCAMIHPSTYCNYGQVFPPLHCLKLLVMHSRIILHSFSSCSLLQINLLPIGMIHTLDILILLITMKFVDGTHGL
jgi:hypothetical protein